MSRPSGSPAPRPPKKTNVVLWIVILLGVLTLGGVVLVVGAKSYLDSPAGKHLSMLLGPASDAYKEGEKAPGAAAVKKAGRCQTASVVDGETMLRAIDFDGGPDRPALAIDFVVCILPIGGPSPSCDDLAQAYVRTTHPTRRFNVQAKHIGASANVCGETYTAQGKPTSL